MNKSKNQLYEEQKNLRAIRQRLLTQKQFGSLFAINARLKEIGVYLNTTQRVCSSCHRPHLRSYPINRYKTPVPPSELFKMKRIEEKPVEWWSRLSTDEWEKWWLRLSRKGKRAVLVKLLNKHFKDPRILNTSRRKSGRKSRRKSRRKSGRKSRRKSRRKSGRKSRRK